MQQPLNSMNPQKEVQRLESFGLRKRLISGFSWAFTGKIATAVIGLGINALLTRLLSPKEMGAYFITFSIVSVSAVLAQMGLNQTVVRCVAESLGVDRPGRARAAIRKVFRFGTFGVFLVSGILGIGAGRWLARNVFHSGLIEGVIGLAIVWTVIISFQNLLAETFRGFHDIRLATIFGGQFLGGLAAGVISGLSFALLLGIKGVSNLYQILILTIIAGAVSVFFGGMMLWQRIGDLEGDGQIEGKEILAIAWPVLITNLTVLVLSQADIWILGIFRPQEEVAIYGAVARLVILVAMPLSIIKAVVPPLIAEMYAQGKRTELEHILRSAATLAWIPAFVALLVFLLFGKSILSFVYGGHYREGAIVLLLLSVGQLVNVWVGSCGLTLIMTGYQAELMMITVACGILTIVGAMWLVKTYGAIGVASIVTAAITLQNILMLLVAKYKTGIWTHVRFCMPVIRDMLRK